MKSKVLVLISSIVLLASSAFAQTCSVSIASGYGTPQSYTGTAVGGDAAIMGGGNGPAIDTTRLDGGFFLDYATFSSDFTEIARIDNVAGGNNGSNNWWQGGGGGLVVHAGVKGTGELLIWTGVRWESNNLGYPGSQFLEVGVATTNTFGTTHWGSFSRPYAHQIPLSLPFYLQIQRTGRNYTVSYSSDSVNWTSIYSLSNSQAGQSLVGVAAWSGNPNGSYGVLSYSHFTVNGSTPALTGIDGYTTGAPGMLTNQIQAGNLTLGTNLLSGTATTNGNCSNGQLQVVSNLILTDLTTGVNLIGSAGGAFTFPLYPSIAPTCNPSCSFSYDYGSNNDGGGDSSLPFTPNPVTMTSGHAYQILTTTYVTEFYSCGVNQICNVNSPTLTFYVPMNP